MNLTEYCVICFFFLFLYAHINDPLYYHHLCLLANFTILNFHNSSTFRIVLTDEMMGRPNRSVSSHMAPVSCR